MSTAEANKPATDAGNHESSTASARDSIDALFHPRRIAIVGATPRPGFAFGIHRLILKGGYEGEVFGVTPRYEEVLGCPCYPTIDAIPGGVDKAIVVVPSHVVLDVLAQAERGGVRAVNIITSGFGEQADEEAHRRQQQIRDFAQRTGIRVNGPNCLGIISTPAKMLAISGPFTSVSRGPIALVLQSGLLSYSTVLPPNERDIGFTYVVTTGNEADLDATDFVRYAVEDDETRVIGCFIEQFRSAAKLIEVAEMAAERGKPIVVLKVGRSEGARRAAMAHTGSLVGSDDIVDAVMRQHGIVRVHNLDEMIETLAVFHSRKLPKGPGVGTIFVSGGAGGLVADLSQDLGLSLPALAPETAAKLQGVIPSYGTVGNPLDTTGQVASQPEIMQGSLEAMAEDPNIDTIIYGQAYPARVDFGSPVGQVMKEIPSRYPDKVFLAMSLVAGRMQSGGRYDQEPEDPVTAWDGVPFLQGADRGLQAVRSLIRYADFQRERGMHRAHAEPSALADRARALIRAAGTRTLTEREAKRVLEMYDIPVTSEQLATSPDEAVAAALALGYPVVLKIESPDIAHKTDAGGVLFNIDSDDAVRNAYDRIMSSAVRYNPDARLTGVLVQQQAAPGHELILGMTQDPDFGPAVAIGLGGIFTETLKDVTLGVPPLSERDCRQMLQRLRAAPILDGAGSRGFGPADVDALVALMQRFGQLCIDLRDEVAEIDINPLLLFQRGNGALVIDCLIVPARSEPN